MYSFIPLLQSSIFAAQQRINFQQVSWMVIGAVVGQTKTMQPWEGSSGMQEGDGMDGQQGIGGRESAQAWEVNVMPSGTLC